MRRFIWLALSAVCSGAAQGAPYYTAASIVNSGNYAPGPFAPDSLVTIFGTDLMVPGSPAPPRVYVDNVEVPLLYSSPVQINFVLSSTQATGNAIVQVFNQGIYGPQVAIQVVDGAPALILGDGGYAVATHADNTVITPDAPAHSGEIVVLYLTGLGKTAPNPAPGEASAYPAQIVHLADLKVLLAGSAVDPSRILYAGLTPTILGLYQINFIVPEGTGADPEIRVSLAGQSSPPGTPLAVRPSPTLAPAAGAKPAIR